MYIASAVALHRLAAADGQLAVSASIAGCTTFALFCLFSRWPFADVGYWWTVCCMIFAVACVAEGFRLKRVVLRLYGLIFLFCCVAKLVTFDMIGLDSSLSRVIALIVGGAICFAVSALYNFAVKRLIARDTPSPDADRPHA